MFAQVTPVKGTTTLGEDERQANEKTLLNGSGKRHACQRELLLLHSRTRILANEHGVDEVVQCTNKLGDKVRIGKRPDGLN